MKQIQKRILLMVLAIGLLQCSDEQGDPLKPLEAPQLISPQSESTGEVDFAWTAVNEAANYRLQLSNSSDFTTLIQDLEGIIEPHVQINLPTWYANYYLRVRAETNAQFSAWSECHKVYSKRPIPKGGLVAYYPFTGNTNDESGNGHDGTAVGATLTTDRNDNLNSAFLFDGLDDYISVPHHNDLNLLGNFTISVWINSDGCMEVCDPPGYHTVIGKRDASSPPDNWPWALSISYINNDVGPFLRTITGSRRTNLQFDYRWSEAQIDLNTWHHVVLVVKNNIQSIYLDGELDSSGEFVQEQQGNESLLLIGASLRTAGIEYLKGKIDDIRLYSRALNEGEIEALFRE